MLYAILILIDNFSVTFFGFHLLRGLQSSVKLITRNFKDKKILVGFIIKFDDGNSILFLI